MEERKKQILQQEGYESDRELSCFVNRKAGKIFSYSWIEEKNVNTVQITLSLPHTPKTWKIFLNPDQPHEETRTALYEKFGRTP